MRSLSWFKFGLKVKDFGFCRETNYSNRANNIKIRIKLALLCQTWPEKFTFLLLLKVLFYTSEYEVDAKWWSLALSWWNDKKTQENEKWKELWKKWMVPRRANTRSQYPSTPTHKNYKQVYIHNQLPNPYLV